MKRAFLTFIAAIVMLGMSNAVDADMCWTGTLRNVGVDQCMCGVNTRIIQCSGGSWLADGRLIPGFQSFVGRVVTACGVESWCGPEGGCPTLLVTTIALGSCTTDVAPEGVAFALSVQNPATNGLVVHFSLPTSASARLELYDVAGRQIAQRDVTGIGPHTVNLVEGKTLSSGVYLVRLTQGVAKRDSRVIVLR